MQDQGLFPPGKHRAIRSSKGSIRLPWIVGWGILLLLVLTVGNALLEFQRDADLLRQDLEAAEERQALAIVELIRAPVEAGDWQAVQAVLKRLEGSLANTRLRLIDPSGALLADSQAAWQAGPVGADRMLPASSAGSEKIWLSPRGVLQVRGSVTNEHRLVMAVFIIETDYQARFAQLYAADHARTVSYLVGVLLILGVISLVNWKLFLAPLNQIYQIANKIKQGNRGLYMPDSNVLELKRISTAFNGMIDHLSGQQAELEALNRNLEATVTERTTALETSNIAIRRRADQLAAINELIASTAGAMDMQTLAETALEQVVRIMQADIGGLQIGNAAAHVEIDQETVNSLYSIAFACQMQLTDRVVVADWEAVESGNVLFPLAQALKEHEIRSSMAVPVQSNGALVGVVGLSHRHARAWTEEEAALLEILAHHLSTVMERTQSMEDLKRHNDLMNTMVEQSERLNRPFTQREVFETIGEGALLLSQADRLAIFTMGENGDPVCVWSLGISDDFIRGALGYAKEIYLPMMQAATFVDLSPLLFSDMQGREGEFPVWNVEPPDNFRAVSAWPLVYEQHVTTFVCCYYNEPRYWKQNEQEILVMFFRQAAVALENARLFEAERDQRMLNEALRDVAGTLNSSLELDEVLDGILSNLGRVVPHSAAVVMMLEDNILRPTRWQGMPEANQEQFKTWRYPMSDLMNRQRMVESVQALVIADTTQNADWVWTTGLEWVRSYAGAPICQRGVVTGFIDVMSGQAGFYKVETAPILQAFANQAAIALENARLYYNSQLRMAETSALYRAVQPLFNPVEDIEGLARGIAESVTKEFASAHCSILLLDESRTYIHLVAQSGSLQLDAPELPLDGPGLTVMAVLTGRTIYAADVREDPNYVYGAAVTRSELAIPLHAGGQVIGVMNLESPVVDAFDERGRRLLVSFAEQAALGLENARLFATIRDNAREMEQLNAVAQRRAQEAETIRQATTALSATLDLQGVLDQILDQMEQVVPHNTATMFLVEDELRVRVWAARNLPVGEDAYYPRNNFLFKEIEETMKPVTLDDVQAEARFCDWEGTNLVRSWMGVPLIRGAELVGFLTLDRNELKVFRPEEMELAQAFANQAAIAVQNARLYEATQQRARELEALHTATTSLVSTLDLQKLLERILGSATSAIPAARSATLHLLDDAGQMHLRVQHGLNECEAESLEWNASNSLWTWVLDQRRPTLVLDTREIPEGAGGNRLPGVWEGGALLISPLLQENRPLGLITLFSPEAGAFAERDLHLLISFASTATAAIQNAQLHSAVQHLAITDPLTSLFNRRGFFNLAKLAMEKAVLLERPISFIMIDIDFFKNVNDRYGHDAGDVVLQVLARRCQQALRDLDLVCRYGGEEFAILLPESDMHGAQAAANRVFKNITETPMETAAGPVWVTISVGVATRSEDCTNLDHLIKRADQALYLAKGFGRNQVQVWKR